MKKIYKNITDIDNGGLIEQANLDFSKIMASINDINTDTQGGQTGHRDSGQGARRR